MAEDAGSLDRGRFLEAWSADDARQETWRDYAISQRAGVTGFPTLVAGPGDSSSLKLNASGEPSIAWHGDGEGSSVVWFKRWKDPVWVELDG